jgi:hypothetical protein
LTQTTGEPRSEAQQLAAFEPGAGLRLWDDPRLVGDHRNLARWGTAICIAGVLVSGCGSGSSSAPTPKTTKASRILSEAIAAVRAVHSYRIQASGISRAGRFSVELESDGPNRISERLHSKRETLAVITFGAFTYVNAPRSFWAREPDLPTTLVRAFGGHWLKVPTAISSELKTDVRTVANLNQATKCWADARSSLSYLGRGSINGHPVLILTDSGAGPGAAPGKIYISATPPMWPLKSVVTGPRKPGGLAACGKSVGVESITDILTFNRHFDISAPAHALTVPIPKGPFVADRYAGRFALS